MDNIITYIGPIEKDKRIHPNGELVICGCGKIGKRVLAYLKGRYHFRKIIFCDKNVDLVGGSYDGIDIFSYEKACTCYKDSVFFIASNNAREIIAILKSFKVRKIHVVR